MEKISRAGACVHQTAQQRGEQNRKGGRSYLSHGETTALVVIDENAVGHEVDRDRFGHFQPFGVDNRNVIGQPVGYV